MFKHFRESIAITILGIIAAWFWAGYTASGSELKTLFIVFFLSILADRGLSAYFYALKFFGGVLPSVSKNC